MKITGRKYMNLRQRLPTLHTTDFADHLCMYNLLSSL